MSMVLPLAVLSALVFLMMGAGVVATGFVVAQPDEWLLHLRNGRVLRAGVGITVFRWPGDQVARFSATLQRVGFQVGALTSERLEVSVQGSILWAVSRTEHAPFRAFSKLGIVNLAEASTPAAHPRKHLLTGPQHKAFQNLLSSIVQRHVASHALEHLLGDQDALVAELARELSPLGERLGIDIEELQILQVKPVDAQTLRALTAPSEQTVQEEAAAVRLASKERIREQEIRSESELALREIGAKQREEAERARVDLELEQERTKLLEAKIAREDREHQAAQDRKRREAEATRDAIEIVSAAEEKKSQPVRDFELERLRTERLAEAFGALPLSEARWVTFGDSPLGTLGTLVGAAGQLWGEQTRRAS